MRLFTYCCVVLVSIMSTSSPVMAQEGAAEFVIGKQHNLHSDILDENRTLWVSLPLSYSSSHEYRNYPVLYVLDGNLFFHPFTGVVQQLSMDATPLIPEMIIVGIDSQNRLKDSTPTKSLIGPNGKASDDWASSGGSEAFQKFLESELVPYIDDQFSTTDYRILAGYSLTGLPVIYNLFTRPNVFDAHIVMDASIWWDDFMIMDVALNALARPKTFKHNQLFITTTTQRYPAPYITVEAGGREFVKLLQSKPIRQLRVVHHERERETHHSLATISLYEGLVSIFDGHMMTLDELYLEPEDIQDRFAQLSERLGHRFSPPEGVINFFGLNFMRYMPEQEMDKAIEYFEMNVEFYPGSANAWANLGEAYLEIGETKKAAKAYDRAVLLKPNHEKALLGVERSKPE